jgi:hypothetical protein
MCLMGDVGTVGGKGKFDASCDCISSEDREGASATVSADSAPGFHGSVIMPESTIVGCTSLKGGDCVVGGLLGV